MASLPDIRFTSGIQIIYVNFYSDAFTKKILVCAYEITGLT